MSDDSNSELSPLTVFIGALLSALMAASNAYVGMSVGMTVSASIPSAVFAVVVFRALRKSCVFRSNLVQTAASAGESLAAGFVFTLPALLILQLWPVVPYLTSVLILSSSGVLGVLFSIPLRKLYIEEEKLVFPEGVATAEIIKADDSGASHAMPLVYGALTGAVFKILQSFFGLISKTLEGTISLGKFSGKTLFSYFGFTLSPALLAVGYIVGPAVSITMAVGSIVSWVIAIPLIYHFADVPESITKWPELELAYNIWSSKIRHLGVGAMVVGGAWTLWSLKAKLLSRVSQLTSAEFSGEEKIDLSFQLRTSLFLVAIICIYGVIFRESFSIPATFVAGGLVLIATSLFSAISGYMAGIVGSSNNPVSGVTIATVLLSGFCMDIIYPYQASTGMITSVIISACVCCAAAIASDNLQDLKAGNILGAIPWKQQWMQIVGVLSAAIVLPPILQVLHAGFGVGSKDLSAPQASLIAAIVEGVFFESTPWDIILIGALLAIVAILIDQYFKSRNSKMSFNVMAFSVGLYLPLSICASIALGGLIKLALAKKQNEMNGVLFASGLVSAEALIGVLFAAMVVNGFESTELAISPIVGSVLFVVVAAMIYRAARKGDAPL